MKTIQKAAAILIYNKKILVARSFGKDMFVAPGGKLELGETLQECLIRELYEEFSVVVKEQHIEIFESFEAMAAGTEDTKVIMHVFFVHQWEHTPLASAEIEEIRWINSSDLATMKIGSIFAHEVIPRLHTTGYID